MWLRETPGRKKSGVGSGYVLNIPVTRTTRLLVIYTTKLTGSHIARDVVLFI